MRVVFHCKRKKPKEHPPIFILTSFPVRDIMIMTIPSNFTEATFYERNDKTAERAQICARFP